MSSTHAAMPVSAQQLQYASSPTSSISTPTVTVAATASKSTAVLFMQKWACAALASAVAETATMPLDVTKTRLQLQGEGIAGHANRGMIEIASGIYRHEGIRALFKGLSPAIIRQSLCAGIGIGAYPYIKHMFVSESLGDLTLSGKISAGMTSGVIGQLIASPTCVVKVRLQADARLSLIGQQPRYHSPAHAFSTILKDEGVSSLFRGVVPSLQRAAAMYGATIPTYDAMKQLIAAKLYNNDSSANELLSTHVMASSVSGLVASIVSTPFDTIKTRMINQPSNPRHPYIPPNVPHAQVPLKCDIPQPVGVGTPLYRSTFDCVMKTVRTEGVGALYKGFLPTWARLGPWQLIFFVMYEQLSILTTGEAFH